jgi:hypothetical protein
MKSRLIKCTTLAVAVTLSGSVVYLLARTKPHPRSDPRFHTPRQYLYQRDRETALVDLKKIQVIAGTTWDTKLRRATVEVDRGFYLMTDEEKRSALEMIWDYYMTANPDSRREDDDALMLRDSRTGRAIGSFGSVGGLDLWER